MMPWEQPGYITTTDYIMPGPGDMGKSQAQLHWERGQSNAQSSLVGTARQNPFAALVVVGVIVYLFARRHR